MKKNIIFLLIIIFIFLATFVIAEDYKKTTVQKQSVPAGTEKVKVGSVTYTVPKGTAISSKDGSTAVESFKHHTQRKLLQIEENIAGIELRLTQLENQIGQLKQALDEIKKAQATQKSGDKK